MTRPDLAELFGEYNREHFSESIPVIPVSWNTRLRTTAGRCHWRGKLRGHWNGQVWVPANIEPYLIDMNLRLFRKHEFNLDMIRDTLIHEMVHAYLIHHHNENGHTRQFHQIMSRITGEWKNHRLHDYNTEGLREQRKIEGHCEGNCGVVGRRARMPKQRHGWTCRKCKSPVVWVDTRPRKTGIKLKGRF